HEQHDRERCEGAFAVQTRGKSLPFEVGGNGIELARQTDKGVSVRIGCIVIGENHFDTAINEKGTQCVKNAMKGIDKHGTGADKNTAHDQGTENAPEEHAML